ncbi:MAG: NADH-Ubiquinone/plastoquinone, partial [Rhizobacter sp.]|nr:NADH-Ubiquinone/plastoquinone [Rhizobacter sp.]
ASGAASLVSLSRAGVRYFWAPRDRPVPRLRLIEVLPIAGLIGVCVAMSVAAEPVIRYTRLAAESLHQPRQYVDAVMSAQPVPGPRAERSTSSAPVVPTTAATASPTAPTAPTALVSPAVSPPLAESPASPLQPRPTTTPLDRGASAP